MSDTRRPRRLGASLIALALVVGLVSAVPATASPAPASVFDVPEVRAWVSSAVDPASVVDALDAHRNKVPAEFVGRLEHVHQGLLRVMVALSHRDASVESFVAGSTTWVKWYFDNPRFYAAVTPDQLKVLLDSSVVTFVEPDVPLTYFMSASTIDIHARSLAGDGTGVWSFDPAAGPRGALRSDVPGLTVEQATGKGVTVAITDSGIDRTHRDFGGWDCAPGLYEPCDSRIVRAVTTEQLIGGDDPGDLAPTTEIASGHGTHVAGTIAGNGYYARDGGKDAATYGADGIPFGVAPEANLIMTKNGDTLWAGMSQLGLEWQLENKDEYKIRVSSNSWGCLGGCSFNGNSATGVLFKDMYNAGILTVFAAGNDAGTNDGAKFSGNAQSPYVLGVASYKNEDHRLAGSSSRGSDNSLPDAATWTPQSEPVNGERRPDVAAPGVDIWSARTLTGGAASGVPRQSSADVVGGRGCCIREYAIMSGTSMATPHVAGAAALAFAACPTSTPLDVMRAVMATAETDILKTTGSAKAEPFEVGYGGLEVRAAVDWLLARNCDSNNSGGEPDPDPTSDPTPTTEPSPTAEPTTEPTAEPTPSGGTTYYFHSPTGIGNADRTNAANSNFTTTAPTKTATANFYDLAPQNGAPQAIYDPYWTGTVGETVRSLDVRFWQRMPVGDGLGEVAFKVTLWAGATPHELPAFTATVPVSFGNGTSLIEHRFTTMLDATGNEIPLEVNLAGQPATITIANNDVPEFAAGAGGYIQYGSVTKPAGFTVNAGAVDPDPTTEPTSDPSESPTTEPTTEPTEDPASPDAPQAKYFFHSVERTGNHEQVFGDPYFNEEAPTSGDSKHYVDPPLRGHLGLNDGDRFDPYWTGTINGTIRSLTVDFWAKAPVTDASGSVQYEITVWNDSEDIPLGSIVHKPDPAGGPERITHTFTTDEAGEPLAIDAFGRTVRVSFNRVLSNVYTGGSYILYDSKAHPSGIAVNPGLEAEPLETLIEFIDTAGSGQHGDEATFSARLTDDGTNPIEGAELIFKMAGEAGTTQWQATTGPDGIATATPALTEDVGAYNLTVHYAGEDGVYVPSSNQMSFMIHPEGTVTTLEVTGKGSKRTMRATLTEDDGPALAGREIVFYANGSEIERGTTDANGVVTLPPPNEYRGDHFDFEARYAGEHNYAGSFGTDRT